MKVTNKATSTISSKYQVVIPKALRKHLALRPGQKITLERQDKKIIIDTESVIDKYAGTLAGAWGEEDAAVVIRRLRDEDRL